MKSEIIKVIQTDWWLSHWKFHLQFQCCFNKFFSNQLRLSESNSWTFIYVWHLFHSWKFPQVKKRTVECKIEILTSQFWNVSKRNSLFVHEWGFLFNTIERYHSNKYGVIENWLKWRKWTILIANWFHLLWEKLIFDYQFKVLASENKFFGDFTFNYEIRNNSNDFRFNTSL